MTASPPKLVIGFGDPVLDIVARVSHELLRQLGADPGGCTPVTAEQMAQLLALPEVQENMIRVPGGSAANVTKGLAGLAANRLSVSFVGMVGADAVGAEYRSSIAAHGVQPLLLESTSGAATATCLCLVTPDGQRTMRTALCAALELSTPQQLPPPLAAATDANGSDGGSGGGGSSGGSMALVHCEGYCLYRSAVAAAAMRAAHAAGARVSLDLASFEVIQNCWDQLDALLQEGLVDIIFCNEQEAEALCQAAGAPLPEGAEQAAAAAQEYLLSQRGVATVVVSRGSQGCTAKSAGGGAATAAARAVQVVDTVGAGDYFTSGFLFALLSGASMQACAECGCAAGTAAVQAAGAELQPAALAQLRSAIDGILAADKQTAAATAVAEPVVA